MSKYTVSELESADKLNNEDLLLVSTLNDDGTYSSKKVAFQAVADQVGEGSGSSDSTGNQESDIISFFTPKSAFKVTDCSFYRSSGVNALLMKGSTVLKAYILSADLNYYDTSLNQGVTVPANTSIYSVPKTVQLSSTTIGDTTYSYVKTEPETIGYTPDDIGDPNNISSIPISALVKVYQNTVEQLTGTAITINLSDPTGVSTARTVKTIELTGNSITTSYTGVDTTASLNKTNLTAAELKKKRAAGYTYLILVTTYSLNQLTRIIDFPANSYIRYQPIKSADKVSYATNEAVVTDEITINEPCAVYVYASFTAQSTSSIGDAYNIQIQVKSTATGDDAWYPIYKTYAIVSQTGRTSINYQMFCRAGVQVRGTIEPDGNSGKIYFNRSQFSFTQCITSGQFKSKEESVQILNIEYKKNSSNIQYIANTDADDAAGIKGRWITLEGNFSSYGGYRRSNLDLTNNMYYLLRRTKSIADTEDQDRTSSDPGDADDNTPIPDDSSDDVSTDSVLQSPVFTNGDTINKSDLDSKNLIIGDDAFKTPFHTVVLNNKNNFYSTYEFFVPAVMKVQNGSIITKYEYSVQLLSNQKLGNNSSYQSYGPNTANIKKIAETTAPTMPTATGKKTKLVFYPAKKKLTKNFNNTTARSAVVGIYKIQQKTVPDTMNLAELELFVRSSTAGKYNYSNVYEKIDGATQLYYCAVHPTSNALSNYVAKQANVVINDVVQSMSVSDKSARYAKDIASRLVQVADFAEGLTTLDDYCFYDCVNLKALPANELSVQAVGEECFSNCKNLAGSIKFNQVTSFGKSTFKGCKQLASVSANRFAGTIPDNFAYECTSLANATLTSAYATGKKSFYKCGLTSITTSNLGNLKQVGESAFAYNTNLTSAKFSGCECVETNAFTKCSSLATLEFVGSATVQIKKNAFSGCPLTGDIKLGNVSLIEASAFNSADKNNAKFIISNASSLPILKSVNAFPSNAVKNTWKIQFTSNAVKELAMADKTWRQLKNRFV